MFTGVGGFSLGINKAISDAICVGFSEIDKYANQVLKYRFGGVKNYGNAKEIRTSELPEFDLLCGGFPCQAFSIAGKRGGFDDTRGTLFFEIARVIEAKRPKIVLLENVKGLLNHDKGKTFATILCSLWELGYDVQWMVLNSKFFGVPQNRERVFIVGSIRGTSRPEILPFGEDAEQVQRIPRKEKFFKRKRNELGKEIRKDYESGIVDCSMKDMRNWEVVEQDHSNTLSSLDIDNIIVSPCITQAVGRRGCSSEEMSQVEAVAKCIGLVPETCKKRVFDTPKEINQYLKDNKCSTISISQVAEHLGLPKTQVEHYFRTDKSRAIPNPEVWEKLRILLRLDDTFDKQVTEIYEKEIEFEQTRRVYSAEGISPTINATKEPIVYKAHRSDEIREYNGVSPCLTESHEHKGGSNQPIVMTLERKEWREHTNSDETPCLKNRMGTGGNNVPMVVAQRGRNPDNPCDRVPGSYVEQVFEPNKEGTSNTLTMVEKDNYVYSGKLRRLTPIECERLQGFPDGWTQCGVSTEEFISYNKLGNIERCNKTKIKKLSNRNVHWKIVKDKNKRTLVTVLCTTKDGKGVETQMSSSIEQKDIESIKNLNANIVITKSENMEHWDCVLNITKCNTSIMMRYTSKKNVVNQEIQDTSEKETEKILTEKIWKKQSEGNYDPMKLSTISTAINLIIDSLTCSFAHAQNMQLSIRNLENLSNKELKLEVSDLKMELIQKISDSSRYKQMGNAVTTSVVGAVVEEVVREIYGNQTKSC